MTELPLWKLLQMREEHTRTMERREISSPLYFTGGQFDKDERWRKHLDKKITEAEENAKVS